MYALDAALDKSLGKKERGIAFKVLGKAVRETFNKTVVPVLRFRLIYTSIMSVPYLIACLSVRHPFFNRLRRLPFIYQCSSLALISGSLGFLSVKNKRCIFTSIITVVIRLPLVARCCGAYKHVFAWIA